LALLLALPAAFLAIWIVVPAPNRALLPLGVGAPEVSLWFILLSVLAIALAASGWRTVAVARVAIALAVIAFGLSIIPLAQFASVADNAEHAMRAALGEDYLSRIPTAQQQQFRTSPLSYLDVLRGLLAPSASTRVDRGIAFDTAAGVVLTMDIHRPATAGTFPVLVQIYGGAWQRGAPGDYAEFAEYIAAQGYVVFCIDYRHAPQFKYPDPVDDVRRALAWIGAHAATWHADTSRMALMGRSAGAHLAMLAAYAPDAPRVRSVIDYYGPVDLVEGYRHPPSPDPLAVRPIEEAFLGAPPERMMDRYRAASPINLVNRVLPPTLLIYGGKDHIVEPRFGRLLADSLHAVHSTAVHVEIPWAEHAFDAVPQGLSGQLSRYLTERFLAWSMLDAPVPTR
jgi:acetyl esterase/lipase